MIRKCPHLVRHGKIGADKKTIEFKDMCGLMIRKLDPDAPVPAVRPDFSEECGSIPFQKGFDYHGCAVYQAIFKSSGLKNNVNPTSDLSYHGALAGSAITDMDLL